MNLFEQGRSEHISRTKDEIESLIQKNNLDVALLLCYSQYLPGISLEYHKFLQDKITMLKDLIELKEVELVHSDELEDKLNNNPFTL